jgi:hypothetical protein
MHAKKISHLYDLAIKTGSPVIGLIDSAGLRLQEATDALNAFGDIYLKQVNASGVVPQITAVFGSCGGGLAIIPHPYCFYRHGLLCKSDYRDLKIDAIETKNARFVVGYCNNKAKKLAKTEHIPKLGASDAHYWKFVGDCFSLIDCEKDIDSVLKAIRKGKTEAHGKGTSNILLSKYLFEKNILKKFD